MCRLDRDKQVNEIITCVNRWISSQTDSADNLGELWARHRRCIILCIILSFKCVRWCVRVKKKKFGLHWVLSDSFCILHILRSSLTHCFTSFLFRRRRFLFLLQWFCSWLWSGNLSLFFATFLEVKRLHFENVCLIWSRHPQWNVSCTAKDWKAVWLGRSHCPKNIKSSKSLRTQTATLTFTFGGFN